MATAAKLGVGGSSSSSAKSRWRAALHSTLYWIRQVLIDSNSYLADWPPPFIIEADKRHHFALRGDRDDEVKEALAAQQRKYWVFKFVDLVFVALLGKLSKVLENCALSFHSFLFVTSLFCLLFVTRLTADEYGVQFIAHDSFHIICYFVYFMSNFIMTLNINVVENDQHSDAVCKADFVSFGFSVGFLSSRAIILILFGRVVYEDELWKEASQKTLGHELHSKEGGCGGDQWHMSDEDETIRQSQDNRYSQEMRPSNFNVKGEGRFIPCEKCMLHELSPDCQDKCPRCRQHEHCFWACKDRCNAILLPYPKNSAPEDLRLNLRMLDTLKYAIIARRLFLAGFDADSTRFGRLQYPGDAEAALTKREKHHIEEMYFDTTQENDGTMARSSKIDHKNLFDISREEDVDFYATYLQELFGEGGETMISLEDEWGAWFDEEKERQHASQTAKAVLEDLQNEMELKAKDAQMVLEIMKEFLADTSYKLPQEDFEKLTTRLANALKGTHERATKPLTAKLELAACRERMIRALEKSMTDADGRANNGAAEVKMLSKAESFHIEPALRKFLSDDREKFLRLARLHCFALLDPSVSRTELEKKMYAKVMYVTFYKVLDEFQAEKMKEDAKKNFLEDMKATLEAEEAGSRKMNGSIESSNSFMKTVDVLSDEEILSKVSLQSIINRGWEQYGGSMIAMSISMSVVVINTCVEYIYQGKALYPSEYKVYAYMMAMCIEIFYDGYASIGRHAYYKVDGDFYNERLRDFLLITLGEAVILLLAPYYNPNDSADNIAQQVYATQISSCCLIFLFAYQFFEKFAVKEDNSDLSEERGGEAGGQSIHSLAPYLFKWLHLLLAICVFFTTSALGLLYGIVNVNRDECASYDTLSKCVPPVILDYCFFDSHDSPIPISSSLSHNLTSASNEKHKTPTPDHVGFVSAQTMLSTSVAFFVIFMTLLRSLKGKGEWSLDRRHRPRLLAKLSKLVFAVLHLCLSSFQDAIPFKLIAGHCALLAANTLSDGQTKGFFSRLLRSSDLCSRLFPSLSSKAAHSDEEDDQPKVKKRVKAHHCGMCGRNDKAGHCLECHSFLAKGFKRGKAEFSPANERDGGASRSRPLTGKAMFLDHGQDLQQYSPTRLQPHQQQPQQHQQHQQQKPRATAVPIMGSVYESSGVDFVSNPMAADASLHLPIKSSADAATTRRPSLSTNIGKLFVADTPLRSTKQRQAQRQSLSSPPTTSPSGPIPPSPSPAPAARETRDENV